VIGKNGDRSYCSGFKKELLSSDLHEIAVGIVKKERNSKYLEGKIHKTAHYMAEVRDRSKNAHKFSSSDHQVHVVTHW